MVITNTSATLKELSTYIVSAYGDKGRRSPPNTMSEIAVNVPVTARDANVPLEDVRVPMVPVVALKVDDATLVAVTLEATTLEAVSVVDEIEDAEIVDELIPVALMFAALKYVNAPLVDVRVEEEIEADERVEDVIEVADKFVTCNEANVPVCDVIGPMN